jgi:peptide/nickel transport system permease protein
MSTMSASGTDQRIGLSALAAADQQISSRRSGTWQRFRRHRIAMVGLVILAVLVLSAIFAPWIAPDNPNATNIRLYQSPPSSTHILGNDASGRDVLSRLLYAGRVSMSVGLVAVSIYLVIGVTLALLLAFMEAGWTPS